MIMNNAVGIGVGYLPIVGDIILAMYKANSRNAMLLEEFLRVRGEEFVKMRRVDDGDGDKEKGAEEAGGWFKGLMKRAKRAGISPKDAEQVKPGAGMTSDEIKQTDTGMSSAGGPLTMQKAIVGDTPPNPGIAKEKIPQVKKEYELGSRSSSSTSKSTKRKRTSGSGKCNLFGTSKRGIDEAQADSTGQKVNDHSR